MSALIAGIVHLDGTTGVADDVHIMLDAMLHAAMPGIERARDVQVSGPCMMGVVSCAPEGAPALAARVLSGAGAEQNLSVMDGVLIDCPPERQPTRLAQALVAEGPEALNALHGEFALAHWDADGSVLHLMTDHVGTRPLHYTVRPGSFIAFSTLMSGLLRTGLAERALNQQSLAQIGTLTAPVGMSTLFDEIAMVEQASTVSIRLDGHATRQRVWRLGLPRLFDPNDDVDGIATELRQRLDRAVCRRLPATGPAGGHVSGGLDSTAIGVLGARALVSGGRVFHGYAFHDTAAEGILADEESERASIAAEAESGLHLHRISRNGTVYDDVSEVDPDNAIIIAEGSPEQQVLRHAAGLGIGTLMSGWCGDEVVTWRGAVGPSEYLMSGRVGAWLGGLARTRRNGTSFRTILARDIVLPLTPTALRGRLRPRASAASQQSMLETLNTFLHVGMKMDQVPHRDATLDSQINRRNWLEHWWIPRVIGNFAIAGAAHGIRYSFPMSDWDLMDFAMRIPGVMHVEEGQNRAVIRRAMNGVLPDAVRKREKVGAPFPAEPLRVARGIARTNDWIDSLSANPLVTKHVRLDVIRSALSQLPKESEMEAKLRASGSLVQSNGPRGKASGEGAAAALLLHRKAHEPAPALYLAGFLAAQPNAESEQAVRPSETADDAGTIE